MGQTLRQTMPFNAKYAFVQAGRNGRYSQKTRASGAKVTTYPSTIGVWPASEAVTGYFRLWIQPIAACREGLHSQKRLLRFSSKQWQFSHRQGLKTVPVSLEGIYKTQVNQSSRVRNPHPGIAKGSIKGRWCAAFVSYASAISARMMVIFGISRFRIPSINSVICSHSSFVKRQNGAPRKSVSALESMRQGWTLWCLLSECAYTSWRRPISRLCRAVAP